MTWKRSCRCYPLALGYLSFLFSVDEAANQSHGSPKVAISTQFTHLRKLCDSLSLSLSQLQIPKFLTIPHSFLACEVNPPSKKPQIPHFLRPRHGEPHDTRPTRGAARITGGGKRGQERPRRTRVRRPRGEAVHFGEPGLTRNKKLLGRAEVMCQSGQRITSA